MPSTLDSMELKASRIDTPIGPLIAISSELALYRLTFIDKHYRDFPSGNTQILSQIREEIDLFFNRKIDLFKTPIKTIGTPFQLTVWNRLQEIEIAQTRSYGDIAREIGAPTAYRAVALACAANPIAIIIPCHRVICSDGRSGGYNGGRQKKEALLALEKK